MSTSIVVTSRNDGYGGHLEFRAKLALEAMAKNYGEVIYVDWCSPNGVSLLDVTDFNGMGNLRHIVVTPGDLEELGRTDLLEIPIVEVLGRNIGIRRASGDWIVSSNIDIMPTPLNVDDLDEEMFYTCARQNVPVDLFVKYKINGKDLMTDLTEMFATVFQPMGEVNDGYSLVRCCGDFQAASKSLWHKMKGFEEGMIYRDCADSNVMKKGIIYGAGSLVIKENLNVFHLDHSGHGETAGVMKKNSWEEWLTEFDETRNEDDWGFANHAFYEEAR